MVEDERGRSLDKIIEELASLREEHGGSIEVLSSAGSVGFRFFSFGQEVKEREGVRDFIGAVGECGAIL